MTKQRKTLIKYLLIIGLAYASFVLTLLIIALCLGLGSYMSLVVRAKLLGEKTAVMRADIRLTVPAGWAVYEGDRGIGAPVQSVQCPDPPEDLRLLLQRDPRSLWRMRRGGAGDDITFYSEQEIYRHVMREDFRSWVKRPEEWKPMTIGGLRAAYVYRYPLTFTGWGTYVGVYVIIPEKDLVLVFGGSDENWELWKKILSEAEWISEDSVPAEEASSAEDEHTAVTPHLDVSAD